MINKKTLVIYTNNNHKVTEIQQLLSLDNFECVPYQSISHTKIDVIEDGRSFEENALIKVQALTDFEPFKDKYILAEDSGIEVEHLSGAPGIYSARYAGESASGTQLCNKLLAACHLATNRRAQYQAVVALKCPDGQVNYFSGICKGKLAKQIFGQGGFGYDPIFIPEGFQQTFGQLPIETKHKLSHRFKALKKVGTFLNQVP